MHNCYVIRLNHIDFFGYVLHKKLCMIKSEYINKLCMIKSDYIKIMHD
jgi:hypothetical protein